jgi:hypothetical protein
MRQSEAALRGSLVPRTHRAACSSSRSSDPEDVYSGLERSAEGSAVVHLGYSLTVEVPNASQNRTIL